MRNVNAGAERKNKRCAAFTFIELLTVVAMVAILAAIAVPNFLEAQIRAKVSTEKEHFALIYSALNSYVLDYDALPPNVVPAFDPVFKMVPNTAALSVLTTPVAYLGQVPRSTFKRSYYGKGRKAGTSRRNYRWYPEEIGSDWHDAYSDWVNVNSEDGSQSINTIQKFNYQYAYSYWQFEENDPLPFPGCKALLLCSGPNRSISSIITTSTIHLISYDTTNGTVSAGDIFITWPARDLSGDARNLEIPESVVGK